jgi:outer membrane protein TolC
MTFPGQTGPGNAAPMRFALPALLLAALAGCTTYQAAPLPASAALQPSLAALPHELPDGRVVDISAPLAAQDVAALAVLNDPDLKAARAQHGVAKAELLAAGLPPDPSFTGGFAALLGGPGTMPAISASLTQDIGALITYRADKQAARAGLAQVDAGILWQEWQVAAQAEQLVVTLQADRATLASLQADDAVLSGIDQATQGQIARNNLTLNEGAASMAALAGVQSTLDTATQNAARDQDQLDALLGLLPGTAIALAPAQIAPPPDDLAVALASLPQRRPDLIALRYGYAQADAKLRAAILTQFLPLSVGAAGGRDTTGVDSAGPQVTLTLPIFNHNRAAVSAAEATRAVLGAQYQAALAAAAGGAQSLSATLALLRTQAAAAQSQADAAGQMAAGAQKAFAAGQISAPALATIQTIAGERTRAAIALDAQLQTAEISLATLLGLGLPPLGTASGDQTE